MIIGIDLSLRSTGVATVSDGHIEAFRIETDSSETRRKRLSAFSKGIYQHFTGLETPDLIVIEEPFITQYVKVTGSVHAAYGVLLAALGYFCPEVPILWVHPMSLKVMVTGYGKSTKEDMKAKIEQVTGLYFQEDEADAVALALVGQAVGEIKVECKRCQGNKLIEMGDPSKLTPCPDCDSFGLIIPSEVQYRKIKIDENYEAILNAFGLSVEGLKELQKQRLVEKKLQSQAIKEGMKNADKP